MKRNWSIIVLCLLFIVGWQKFVVNPFLAKQKTESASPSTSSPQESLSGSESPASSALKTAQVEAPQGTSQEMSALEGNSVEVALGDQKTIQLYSNFSLGSAQFHNYSVREQEVNEKVRILEEGIRWNSTDPDLQKCLLGLKQEAQTGSVFSREYRTALGQYCRLRLAVDPAKAGLIHVELSLSGFVQKPGSFVELKGLGALGAGPAQDHNHLGFVVDGSRSWVREKDLFKSDRKEGKVDWVAWGDKYFLAAFLPEGNFNPNVVYGPVVSTQGEEAQKTYFGLQYPVLSKDGASVTYELSLYFGTRDPEQLAKIRPSLKNAVDLGFFGSVARLLMWTLNKFNVLFHNFGLSIIALTLLVRFLFWPLNKKVFASSLKMKALQPEMERIKKKYGKDRAQMEQMNKEVMNLYRVHKVNPAGSCLPMLLQLPIFIGLYAALGHSIDLYQAPFFGWIHDLSSRDPFYVFPALWTVSLLAYMKLNPQGMSAQPGQPDMKWLMVGMNVFFGFLSKDWPAGLTLYLFVSNLVGILQQVMMKRDPKLQPIQEGV